VGVQLYFGGTKFGGFGLVKVLVCVLAYGAA
jgi:hypothetical protein